MKKKLFREINKTLDECFYANTIVLWVFFENVYVYIRNKNYIILIVQLVRTEKKKPIQNNFFFVTSHTPFVHATTVFQLSFCKINRITLTVQYVIRCLLLLFECNEPTKSDHYSRPIVEVVLEMGRSVARHSFL